MKNILFISLILFCSSGYSQESIHVKGKDYEGYVFNKEHFAFISVTNQKDRYTPTKEDIVQVEILLKDSIDYVLRSQDHYQPSINCRTIRKYKRQYVGFVTNDNNVVVWINFLRNKDIKKEELSKEIITVLDGGENYWYVFVNLTKKELFGMRINGVS